MGSTSVVGLFNENGSRYQCVFGSYDMELPNGVHYITGMALRIPSTGNSVNGIIPDVEIRISTTQGAPDLLAPDFARNTGPDETVVHARGPLQVNATFVPGVQAQPFAISIPFESPFVYDRSWGNLLLDIRTYDAGTRPFIAGGIASPDFARDSVSSMWGTISSATSGNPGSYSIGLAVQFEYHSVPEPSVVGLAGLGLLGVLLGRRIRQS